MGHLQLSFACNKLGIESFALAFIKVGQGSEPGREANIRALLPLRNYKRESIFLMADSCRKKLKVELSDILRTGGGINCNVFKVKRSGKPFYEFVIDYCHVKVCKITGYFEVMMVCIELFLSEETYSDSVDSFRTIKNAALMKRFSTPLTSPMNKFTFVTDCAITMFCILRDSTSLERCPRFERWMRCTVYMLNTCMKHDLNGLQIPHSNKRDIETVNEITTDSRRQVGCQRFQTVFI